MIDDAGGDRARVAHRLAGGQGGGAQGAEALLQQDARAAAGDRAVRHGDVSVARTRAEAARARGGQARGARRGRAARRGRGGASASAAAAFLVLSFFAYQYELPSLNFAGRVGHGLADVVGAGARLRGLSACRCYLAVVAVLLFRHAAGELSVARARRRGGAAALRARCCSRVAAPPPPARPVTLAGGWFGGFLAALLARAVRRRSARSSSSARWSLLSFVVRHRACRCAAWSAAPARGVARRRRARSARRAAPAREVAGAPRRRQPASASAPATTTRRR